MSLLTILSARLSSYTRVISAFSATCVFLVILVVNVSLTPKLKFSRVILVKTFSKSTLFEKFYCLSLFLG